MKKIYLCLLMFVFITINSNCTVISIYKILDMLEKRSDTIETYIADVKMYHPKMKIPVMMKMIVENPDKFRMDFGNKGVKVIFNGQTLWLYIPAIKEVLIAKLEGGDWFHSFLQNWINPKKVITKVTKTTLANFFNVKVLKSTKDYYLLRFTPKGAVIWKKIFDIGYYEMAFDKKTMLPIKASEYSANGKKRGWLKIEKYELNKSVDRKMFEFKTPKGVTELPMSKVIIEQIKLAKDKMMKKIKRSANNFIDKISDFSFFGN